MKNIRAKSVCIFRHNGKVLLSEGHDPTKDEYYLMPIGGGIDFGETSEQAARREVLEEIGAEAHAFQLLGVRENLFTFNGSQGHEIVFIYEARFKDARLYDKPEFQGVESNGLRFIARWFSQAQISSHQTNVYPAGIMDMLFR